MIKANAHKYAVSALCRCLGIARSTYYYEIRGRKDETELEEAVQTAFDENRRVYGTRKLKHILGQRGIVVSRRRISRIMKKLGLVCLIGDERINRMKHKDKPALPDNKEALEAEIKFLRKQVYQLQMECDVLEEAAEILKKTGASI